MAARKSTPSKTASSKKAAKPSKTTASAKPKKAAIGASGRPKARARAQKPLGVAMVGHSFMGRAHGNAFRQVNHFFDLPYRVERRVVVGRSEERAEAMREKLGFDEASADLDAVLARDDIQLIDVATPNDTHAEIASAALKAGKHVLCEKPLAMNIKEAKALVRAAAKAPGKVGLWHNYRRAPAASLAQRLISRGEIGDVRQVRAVYLQDWLASPDAPWSWRNDQSVCGSGAHGDLNAHLIDMTLHLTGLQFESVCALQQTFTKTRRDGAGKRKPVDVDDALMFMARFKGGAIGSFEATRTAPGHKNFNQIEVHGTHGTVRWNFERMNELEFFSARDAADAQGFRTIMCMDEPHPYAANWWPDGHIIGYEHTFVNHLADFIAGLDSRKAFRPNFEDGLHIQAVLDTALKSAQSNRWANVPAV